MKILKAVERIERICRFSQVSDLLYCCRGRFDMCKRQREIEKGMKTKIEKLHSEKIALRISFIGAKSTNGNGGRL